MVKYKQSLLHPKGMAAPERIYNKNHYKTATKRAITYYYY